MKPKRRQKPEPDTEAVEVPIRRKDSAPKRKARSSPSGSGPLSAEQLSAAFASLSGSPQPPPAVHDDTPNETAAPQTDGKSRTEDSPQEVASKAPEQSPQEQVAEKLPADHGDVTPLGIIEAVLFTGDPTGEALDSERIAALIRGVDAQEINGHVETLNLQYEEQQRPYRIVNERGGYRMALFDEFDQVRDRFYGRIREARLSQAAVEVLAAVAYNQPTTSERIRELRGTQSGAVLNQLVRRKLLRVERGEKKPRKAEYYVTQRFLNLFGLTSLEDLPRSEELNQR